jgi:sporulation protein YlmC with PRC-barrel domain
MSAAAHRADPYTASGLAGSSRGCAPAADREPGGPGPEVMAASSLEGETVMSLAGDTLGEIEELMLDVKTGRIAYAILAVGGFLGIGEKYFAVPWRALTLDPERKCFVLDVDKDRLENAPGFDRDPWPAMADESWATAVHEYYRTQPYWT